MNTRYLDLYAAFLKKFLAVRRPLRVVFDCSNGTAGRVLRELFKTHKLISVQLIHGRPDGRFPAHGPDPLAPRATDDLERAVRRAKADLGVIFDADGDRVFFIDDAGRKIHSDATAYLIGANGEGPVLLDVRSGYLARELFRAAGRRILVERVGHYFIKKRMRKDRIPFAAEFTGHYYFKDFFFCDSGIFAAINMINQISNLPIRQAGFKTQNVRLSAWLDGLPRYYSSGEVNFRIRDKDQAMTRILRAYRGRARRISRMDGIKMEFGPSTGSTNSPHAGSGQGKGDNEWWLLARPSNTEDLLRLTLEAKRENVFKKELRGVREIIKHSS